MGKFELPSLDDMDSKNEDIYENDEPSVFNSTESDDSLIDLNDPDEEDLFSEEDFYEDDDTIAKFKELVGIINAVKINDKSESTAIQLDSKTEGLVYLQDSEINHIAEKGLTVKVTVDTENAGVTKTGIPVYQLIELVPLGRALTNNNDENESNEIKQPSSKKPKLSITDKIKNAISEVKKELNDNNNDTSSNSDDNEDLYDDEDNSEELPKKSNKNKRPNPIKLLYLTIADFLLSLIMNIIEFLSRIPLIGKVFSLLNKLEPIFKIITRLWLPIVVLILFFVTNSFVLKPNPNYNKDESIVKVDNISIEVQDTAYKDGKITLSGTNHSKVYADFYFTAELKEEKAIPFLGKKSKCKSDYTVLGINETKQFSLRCDTKLDKAKIKNIDIVLDN